MALLSVQMQKLLKSHITHIIRLGFSGGSVVESTCQSRKHKFELSEDHLENETATYSSILDWEVHG